MFLPGRNVFARIITHQISWPICDCVCACLQFVFIFATFATLFSHPYAPFVFIWTGAQDHQTTFIAQVLLFLFFFFIFFCNCLLNLSFFSPKHKLYLKVDIVTIFSALFLEISNIQDGTTKLETFFIFCQLLRNMSLVVISW